MEAGISRLLRLTIVLCLAHALGSGQTVSDLEAMERLAEEPSTRVVHSREVARIVAGASSAVITALILEDRASYRRIRGLRIDLSNADKSDVVYASEDSLALIELSLQEISGGMGTFFSRSAGSASKRCFGSGVFLGQRREGAHVFSASQCMSMISYGLEVSTGREVIQFAGQGPAAFSVAFAQAHQELMKL